VKPLPIGPRQRDPALAATPLEQKLAAEIAITGPVTVAHLMQVGLYDPQNGYYTTRQPLGLTGDFTTAPEISQMFGELIGLWLAQRWLDMGRPTPVEIIELGPGRGTLMADAVRAMRQVPGLLGAARITLVEVNPLLQAAQAETLEQAPVPVSWASALLSVADGPTLLVANEFLDCLPIHQLVVSRGQLCERRIGANAAGRLDFVTGPPVGPAASGLADGVVLERAPGLAQLIGQLARRARSAPLSALFIDYGHTGCGHGDTLQALYRHTKVHPLDRLGEADLTAHVDFGAVASHAASAGLLVHGPVAQGAFLRDLGIAARARKLSSANPQRALDIASALDRLTGTDGMGDLFKVIGLSSSGLPDAPGLPPATLPQSV
jgi:NADH dehydrogenase [ubiquinone] 1 alpha subcomplex assembly factor 7